MNLKFKPYELSLIKLTTVSVVLLLISAWSALANWVVSTNWIWFLVAAVVFAIKPLITMFKD
jgi:hypothetical protein